MHTKNGGKQMHTFQEVKYDEISTDPYRISDNRWMLVTSVNGDKVNMLTASWGGSGVIWGKRCAFIFIRKSRYTREFIEASNVFSLSFLNQEKYHGAMKYIGTVSGRNEDKLAGSRLSIGYDKEIPYIDEAEFVMECRVLYKQEMGEAGFLIPEYISKFYPDKDFHVLYIGEIEKMIAR